MHESVGKNGIGPPQLAPARIIRPGDPGFPAAQEPTEGKFRNCQHPGCGRRYMPTVPGVRYCLEHNTYDAQAARDAGMVRTPVNQVRKERPVAKEDREEKLCAHEGCAVSFTPKRKDSSYCPEHATSTWSSRRFAERKAAQQGKPGPRPAGKARTTPVRKASSKKPAAPVVAAAIASLRTKEGKAPAKVIDSAFDTQVGGDHYRQMAIQPVEFIAKNNLGFCAGNVIKYVCRHHAKGGAEDLDKAIHYLQLERETLYGKATA